MILFGYTSASYAQNEFYINRDIELTKVKESTWIHTSYYDFPDWKKTPANGLLVIDGSTAAIVDTPWTNEQTAVLFDWIESNFRVKITHVIVSHSHDDCMGGLSEVHKRGIESYALDLTRMKAQEQSKPIPKNTFSREMVLQLGEKKLILSYFGGGHSIDNIVVWVPQTNVLFSGCLVKSINSNSLGNTKEANIESWLKTLHKVEKTYSSVETVIPGHGSFGDKSLIRHTINLCNAFQN